MKYQTHICPLSADGVTIMKRRAVMKYIVILGDGMSDEPMESLGGRTPLEVANIPTMDELASMGELGMVQNVPPGMAIMLMEADVPGTVSIKFSKAVISVADAWISPLTFGASVKALCW